MTQQNKLIRLPQIYNCGGRFSSKDKWFIEFYVRDPQKPSKPWKRVKKYQGINKFHTLKEREAAAEKMKQHWTDKLLAGWNAFTDTNIIYDDNLQFQTVIKSYRKATSQNGTFRYYASKYIDWKKSELAKGSLSTYRSRLRIFDNWLEGQGLNDADISTITNKSLVDFSFVLIEDLKRSKTTVQNYQNLLKELFDFVRKERKQYPNPVFELPKTKYVSDSAAYPIQEFDIIKFKTEIKKSDPQLWMGCQFVYYCFLRPRKELRNLKIGDIDFGRSVIRVSEANAKTTQRMVSIPQVFMREIMEVYKLHECNRDWYVIGNKRKPGPEKVSYNNMGTRFSNFRNKLGLPKNYVMYSWKHTGNVRAADSGIPMRDLQGQNGHTTVQTTEIYMKNKRGARSEYIIDNFPSI